MSVRAGSRRAAARRILQIAGLATLIGVLPIGVVPAGAAHLPVASVDGNAPRRPLHRPVARAERTARQATRRRTLTGLVPSLPGGACPGLLEIVGVSPLRCTHGADGASIGRKPATPATSQANATSARDPLVGSSGHVLCYGDGQEGPRIEVIYATVAGSRDRFASVVGSIRNLAANVDNVMAVSASKTGGDRHYRFVTDTNCALVVHDVALSSTGDRSFAATINDLIALGYDRTDRQYLVLVDSSVYCGIATANGDDQPYVNNSSNQGPGYARIDKHCWSTGAAAHEMMHMLGAVQLSAPHSTGHYHCTDTPDVMCYADGPGVATVQRCPSNQGGLYDCNNDDYFNTSPSADSYLDTYWNTANNQFLETRPGSDTFPGPPLAPPAGRHKTVSEVFSGSLGPTNHMEIIPIDAYDGPITVHLEYGGIGGMATRLEDPSGLELATWSGPSPQDHYEVVTRGSYRIVLSGDGPLNYHATVGYVAP